MINGGNATVFVSDMDRAVKFYTEILGLKLDYRAENHWAQISAGNSLLIGLHLGSQKGPKPGERGAISIGLTVAESLESVVSKLSGKGVKFEGPIKDDGGVRLAFLGDPDGNELYLCEVKKW